MRTVALPLLFLALVCSASAQITYTTTANGCGGKNIGYCRIAVASDSASDVVAVTFDNRNLSGRLLLNHADGSYSQYDGRYAGFVPNPDGTYASYYGLGTYSGADTFESNGSSPKGTVQGQLQFYAYYVGTCAGRGCGPVVIGWHYEILSGSTVTLQ